MTRHPGLAEPDDVFQRPELPVDVGPEPVRARIAKTVREVVHPAMCRLAAVRRHTTTDLTPEQVHDIGRAVLGDLQDEWLELGGQVLGTTDLPSTLARVRDDPSLRLASSQEIVGVVTSALERAGAVRDPDRRPAPALHLRVRGPCLSREHPRRPSPADRLGADAHPPADVPPIPGRRGVCLRRGLGLYSERLADEMGLYSSTVQRLGAGFNIRGFHGVVLSNGAVPLKVLEGVVTTWADSQSTSSDRSLM